MDPIQKQKIRNWMILLFITLSIIGGAAVFFKGKPKLFKGATITTVVDGQEVVTQDWECLNIANPAQCNYFRNGACWWDLRRLSGTCMLRPPEQCLADQWQCGDWGSCSATGSQTRTCTKLFDCPTVDTPSPPNSQTCTPSPNIAVGVFEVPVVEQTITASPQSSLQTPQSSGTSASDPCSNLSTETSCNANPACSWKDLSGLACTGSLYCSCSARPLPTLAPPAPSPSPPLTCSIMTSEVGCRIRTDCGWVDNQGNACPIGATYCSCKPNGWIPAPPAPAPAPSRPAGMQPASPSPTPSPTPQSTPSPSPAAATPPARTQQPTPSPTPAADQTIQNLQNQINELTRQLAATRGSQSNEQINLLTQQITALATRLTQTQTAATTTTPAPSVNLTCEQRGKYTYTGPTRTGVRTKGMCIDCPTKIYLKYGGKCTPPEITEEPSVTEPHSQTPLPSQSLVSQTRPVASQAPQDQTRISAYKQPISESEQVQFQEKTPSLMQSQRLIRAPERSKTGPEALVYIAIVAALHGAWFLRKKLRK